MLTPLNSIIGLSNILRIKYEGPAHESENQSLASKDPIVMMSQRNENLQTEEGFLVKVINFSAVLLHHMVQDFVDMLKISKGELELSLSKSHLKRTCYDVLKLFEVQI